MDAITDRRRQLHKYRWKRDFSCTVTGREHWQASIPQQDVPTLWTADRSAYKRRKTISIRVRVLRPRTGRQMEAAAALHGVVRTAHL